MLCLKKQVVIKINIFYRWNIIKIIQNVTKDNKYNLKDQDLVRFFRLLCSGIQTFSNKAKQLMKLFYLIILID